MIFMDQFAAVGMPNRNPKTFYVAELEEEYADYVIKMATDRLKTIV